MKRLAILLLLCGTVHAQSVNPAVTQSNIQRTICVPGWTKTVRPSTSYTNGIKRELMKRKHIDPKRIHEFELDHWIPLAVGGHPSDPRNLWLQPWSGPNGAHRKDVMESRMHRSVCAGKVTLRAAQECMASGWRACLP